MQKTKTYIEPRGTWCVTTEGDCEGRSTTNLGTWVGYVDEIALHLAKESFYTLQFTRISDRPAELTPAKDMVHVRFGHDSGFWNLRNEERIEAIAEAFADRPVDISKSNYASSFTITKEGVVTQEMKDKTRLNEMLSTLTLDDRKLLRKFLAKDAI